MEVSVLSGFTVSEFEFELEEVSIEGVVEVDGCPGTCKEVYICISIHTS